MHDRVGHRFAHGDVDAKGGFVSDAAVLCKARHGGSSLGNRLDVAGQNESSRLVGHKSRGLFRRESLLTAASKLTEDGRVTCSLAVCQESQLRFFRDHST